MTTKPFEISQFLDSDNMIAEYLSACLEEGGQELFLEAIGDAIKAMGARKIVEKAGLGSRTSVYKSFSSSGNPELATIHAVLDSMGMQLAVVPKAQPA